MYVFIVVFIALDILALGLFLAAKFLGGKSSSNRLRGLLRASKILIAVSSRNKVSQAPPDLVEGDKIPKATNHAGDLAQNT